MKTYLIALAASAAFATAAFAGEMQSAPAAVDTTIPAPATAASMPDDKVKPDVKEEAAPAEAASLPSEKAKTEDKPAVADKAASAPKKLAEHHAKYHNGEGSTWKTGRNAYGFEGSFGGCQFRGHAGPDGYHIDKAC